jgi:hypothetical protein
VTPYEEQLTPLPTNWPDELTTEYPLQEIPPTPAESEYPPTLYDPQLTPAPVKAPPEKPPEALTELNVTAVLGE